MSLDVNYSKIIIKNIFYFFNKYTIVGVKSKYFEDWAKIAKMIERKVHLTNKGFDKIRLIRKGIRLDTKNKIVFFLFER